MRKFALFGWALTLVLGAALFLILRPLNPVRSFGDCPAAGPGVIHGPPTQTAVTDEIDNATPGGSPLSLKIRYVAAPGVCVDGQSGDVHLYEHKTLGGDFTVTFARNLAGQAAWPLDATKAVQTADIQGGPWASAPGAAVTGNGATLTFSIPYQKGRKDYFYRLQYTNPQGPADNLQVVEPMIRNH